jgi:MoaA/NifB/PqqE/SkfB family radical SAM enzyme
VYRCRSLSGARRIRAVAHTALPGWLWRLRFLRGYVAGFSSTTGPRTAVIDVTTQCNLHCFGCRRHALGASGSLPTGGHFPWELFVRLCSELRAFGTSKMVFVGEGEPLLHPQLPNMLKLAKRCGFFTILVTNGTLLASQGCDPCLNVPADVVRVSLWASSEEEYARNCAGNASHLFNSVVQGLKKISTRRRESGARSPKLMLFRPIDRGSYRGLDAMVSLAQETGCDALSFAPLRSVLGPHHERGLSRDEEPELLPILRRVHNHATAVGLSTNVPEASQVSPDEHRRTLGEHRC